MKVLVTGAGGQVGWDTLRELERRGHEGVGLTHRELDICDREAVHRCLLREKPDALVHCAAWTAVDAAQVPENLASVRRVNVDGTRYLAQACREVGCKMLYLSTDYVFGGEGDRPWQADGEAFHPLNVYGQSKLDGELAVKETLDAWFILRISWVFGANGQNFVKTMLRLGESRPEISVVQDQVGAPTYSRDLARLMVDMIGTDRYGCYHATNSGGYISWYTFAREIFRQAGMAVEVSPVSAARYGAGKAPRPGNSRLDCGKLLEAGFRPLPSWQDGLNRYLKEIGVI